MQHQSVPDMYKATCISCPGPEAKLLHPVQARSCGYLGEVPWVGHSSTPIPEYGQLSKQYADSECQRLETRAPKKLDGSPLGLRHFDGRSPDIGSSAQSTPKSKSIRLQTTGGQTLATIMTHPTDKGVIAVWYSLVVVVIGIVCFHVWARIASKKGSGPLFSITEIVALLTLIPCLSLQALMTSFVFKKYQFMTYTDTLRLCKLALQALAVCPCILWSNPDESF